MTYAILTSESDNTPSRRANITLWVVQILLAALFLFAGGMKLVMPIEVMTKDVHLPALFLRFIGVAEVAGAIGLVLPGVLRIHAELTSFAAAGLVVIMIGATSVTLTTPAAGGAILPVVVGLLAAFVAIGRLRVAHRGSSLRLVLRTA